MPYRIEKLQDAQNIILVTFSGAMTAQDVSQSVKEVVEMAEDMPRPVYQVGDFREAEGSFGSVLSISQTFPNMWRVYRYEKIIGPIAVQNLDSIWLRLSNSLARKMNLTPFISFPTIDDARTYIAEQLTERA